MKKVCLFLVLCFCVGVLTGCDIKKNDEYDFRETIWGMTYEKVIELEKEGNITSDSTKENGFLAYENVMVNNFAADLIYSFDVNGKLYQGGYIIKSVHITDNNYILDYEANKKALTEKYGSPKNDEMVWIDDLYKDDTQQYGFAVSIGHLGYWAEWETETTKILIILGEENLKITQVITYTDINFDSQNSQKKDSGL